MFEEKKNATSYNYTKEFPPTLRDLVARVRNSHQTVSNLNSQSPKSNVLPPQLGDFKYDYQQMVARLGPLLKAEHEGRLTYIQWQLDEIAEQVWHHKLFLLVTFGEEYHDTGAQARDSRAGGG